MIRFIDLFAGIGGLRLGFEQAGANCVFSSEWDRFSQMTYEANFGEKPHGDICMINVNDIPDHDILIAGFPCQPFSISGVSKKNSLGRKHGFEDEKQGNLFFEIERIIAGKRPAAFLLENVKHLKRHDRGNTFRVIEDILVNKLNYRIFVKIVDAQHYVPQHRERIFIIGLDAERYPTRRFKFPDLPLTRVFSLDDVLDSEVDKKYTLSDHLWNYLQEYKRKHEERGNGFGYGLIQNTANAVTRTLSARYHKDGSEILISQKGKNPRRLTPRECARLMGFPENFQIPVSDTQAYRQFGNSVVVPLVFEIASNLITTLQEENDFCDEVNSLPTQLSLQLE